MNDNDKAITPKLKRQLTKPEFEILKAAAEIAQNSPTEEDRAFMARQLVQATLPHKNPGNVPAWSRTNGNLTLGIQPGVDFKTGKSYGYPYGTLPRLLLFWMTTEAVKTKTPRLELGNTLAAFMRELGLDPARGGKRSDARRLRDQMERLFQARISFQATLDQHGRTGRSWLNMQVTNKGVLWWNPKLPEQGALWGSWIELTPDFYAAITSSPVPVDMRALLALKKSPLALDLYAWLSYEAYRAHKTGNPRFVSWHLLMEQLGAEYTGDLALSNFRAATKAALRKINAVYPGLKLGQKQGGIEVLPASFAAIQPLPDIEGEVAR